MVFPKFPADEEQLLKEKIVEPAIETIQSQLSLVGIPGEAELWKQAEIETLTATQW